MRARKISSWAEVEVFFGRSMQWIGDREAVKCQASRRFLENGRIHHGRSRSSLRR